MPHFIIECSAPVMAMKSPEEIIQKVYDTAEATELFSKGDIKVRIHPYTHYTIGNTKDDFIHVFSYIMEGRSHAEKNMLAKRLVTELKLLFPNVPIVSINIKDFEKVGYCNKSMV
ncbi:5-carboxymethyl-2-hydroxymuconate Delta-isomerase [Kriegella aquimaris]|uniref:5-carboxymethyl-2-hydroxymuconate isomerase n=1 Tax=Kriegella aquimaris TaxID=192904 RepID=A0A1G9IHL2_9FLAO|nr:5-carboxymethyl-2-hydroxymuconate Delta-isomerase [Kriegella aquimaris]SDL24667.1 5-carboxymethyl-2-hydroxymuconate isomerase [Kriegella aquimaris]